MSRGRTARWAIRRQRTEYARQFLPRSGSALRARPERETPDANQQKLLVPEYEPGPPSACPVGSFNYMPRKAKVALLD
jgi:hypothetical protein